MEDSTSMTIDFLRARLLSERSVSRTARLRADELAKRVLELEKQLKIVSLQRKKAEKATAEVLAILESHGRSDVSETFDSSCDEDTVFSDTKDGTSSVKGEETSGNVKGGENDVEAFSGSEHESSLVSGRSLSWKSSKESVRVHEKSYMDASRRRRNSFASTGCSPKRIGKSCRQVRRREHGSKVEGVQNDASSIARREDEIATSSEGVHNCSDIGPETSREGSENREEKDLLEFPVSTILDNPRLNNGHYLGNLGGEKDMERALEHQAQLIGRYEAEEKAQREWEDKFGENNGSIPDSCDPGNHSDITEERDEIKAPAPPPPCSTGMSALQNDELEPRAEEAYHNEESKTHSDFRHTVHIDTHYQEDDGIILSKSQPPESAFSFPNKGKRIDEEYPDNDHFPQSQVPYHSPELQGISKTNSGHVPSSEGNRLLYQGEASGKTSEFALTLHEDSGKLGSILEALQHAKLSLRQNLIRLPSLGSGSMNRGTEPTFPIARSGERFSLPTGTAGLFRLPTDYQYGATSSSRASLIGSDARISIGNYSPDHAASTRFLSSASVDNRYLTVPTFPYKEAMSGTPVSRAIVDPRLEPGMLSFSDNRYVGPDPYSRSNTSSPSLYTHASYPSYQEPRPRMPDDGRTPHTLPGSRRDPAIPPPSRISSYNGYTHPNMYR